jgi:hypothetical protein
VIPESRYLNDFCTPEAGGGAIQTIRPYWELSPRVGNFRNRPQADIANAFTKAVIHLSLNANCNF